MDWQVSATLRNLFSTNISRWTSDTKQADEMSKLSSAVCPLTTFSPKAEFIPLSSRHTRKNKVTSSLSLHLPVHQVSFLTIIRSSKIGNAAQAFEAGILNMYANVSSWKQSDTSTSRQTHALVYLGENIHLHTQHSLSVTSRAGAAAAASPVPQGSAEEVHQRSSAIRDGRPGGHQQRVGRGRREESST